LGPRILDHRLDRLYLLQLLEKIVKIEVCLNYYHTE
jgi:hypothetical protein